MEILILGLVLLILGVGATFVYDKHKERKAQEEVERQTYREAMRAKEEERAKRAAKLFEKPKPRPAPKATTTTTKKTVRKTIKPGSIKAGPYKPNDPPVETEYINELFDDVSINSQLTVQELIAKIEQMKKK